MKGAHNIHLLALPFQKHYYTYLSQTPIKGAIMVHDLPIAYHNLVNQVNGGYSSKGYFKSPKPSPDALDAVYIPYMAGLYPRPVNRPYLVPNLLDQESFQFSQELGAHDIIFYEDPAAVAYLAFPDDLRGSRCEAKVYYQHFATGQKLLLAQDFETFLGLGQRRHFPLPAPPIDSYHRANAAFLHVDSAADLDRLLQRYQGHPNQTWFLKWVTYFSQHPEGTYRDLAQAYLKDLKKK
ncbi:hypothetical protein [Aerococcus sp. Group 1]|uniref:hypothetical protein n=1 Tax=Aerococcus urinae (strain CCUG 59500 / ACS-120-V-Col10a) TaxID=2976812 RepID=UPI00227D121B|nr:hypothetical protein [Aerococcus sp. Group 1]MCY3031554.1 hypothetical protein [Aerococcus sp. Group 1]